MGDVVRVLGMEFYAFHGSDAEEQVLGQRFEVDVEVHRDLRQAGETDDLNATINYREVYAAAAAAMDPPTQLIETVAERIATDLLARFTVDAVVVRVRKPSVPIGGVVRCSEVELHRP